MERAIFHSRNFRGRDLTRLFLFLTDGAVGGGGTGSNESESGTARPSIQPLSSFSVSSFCFVPPICGLADCQGWDAKTNEHNFLPTSSSSSIAMQEPAPPPTQTSLEFAS